MCDLYITSRKMHCCKSYKRCCSLIIVYCSKIKFTTEFVLGLPKVFCLEEHCIEISKH